MIRICAWCNKVMGEKKPLSDKSETHGICQSCLDKEMGTCPICNKRVLRDQLLEGVGPCFKCKNRIDQQDFEEELGFSYRR